MTAIGFQQQIDKLKQELENEKKARQKDQKIIDEALSLAEHRLELLKKAVPHVSFQEWDG